MQQLIFSLLVLPSVCFCALTEKEAEKIGTELYIYGYPLVTMDLTRQVMTNTVGAEGAKAPMGQFVSLRSYPDALMKEVTTPNADTLYSWAWINVSNEPYILHIPDEDGRYYLISMLDGWTEVFADPGTRTTGTEAGDYVITGPDWKGELPSGVRELKSSTQMVWVIGRTYCNGTPEDYAAVHKIQDQYSLTPLSFYENSYTAPAGTFNPKIDMKTPVRDQVNNMAAAIFFSKLSLLMKENPPGPKDSEIVREMEKIGFVPGVPFDMAKLDKKIVKALERAPQLGVKKIMQEGQNNGKIVNGWLVWFKTGEYGTNYLLRASVAAMGLGANLPADAVYPIAKVDSQGNPFTGKNKYILHFAKEDVPPVNGFWSLTLYNDQYFFAANPLNRYNLSSHSPIKYNEDGSLDLYIQNSAPDKGKEANWLPAPRGAFILLLRLYWPKESVVNESWTPPGVQKI